MEVQELWIQQLIRNGAIRFVTIGPRDNGADILAKDVARNIKGATQLVNALQTAHECYPVAGRDHAGSPPRQKRQGHGKGKRRCFLRMTLFLLKASLTFVFTMLPLLLGRTQANSRRYY